MLCVVRDIVDPVQDQRLAEFVVGSHAASHPEAEDMQAEEQQQQNKKKNDPDIMDQDMLRKYITFAKQQYKPAMSQVGGSCSYSVGVLLLLLHLQVACWLQQLEGSQQHRHRACAP